MSRNLIIVASVSLIFFMGVFGFFMRRQSCPVQDQTICRFLRSSSDSYAGTWTRTDTPSMLTIHWILKDKTQEIWHEVSSEEQFHLVQDEADVYVKDIRDGRWWRQSIEVSRDFQTKLPFEPLLFFDKLKKDLSDKKTAMALEKKEECSGTECMVYLVRTAEKQYRVYVGDDRVQQIEVIEGVISTVIDIEPGTQSIEIPTIGVQDVSDTNIILEAINRVPESRSVPTFVKEFEQSRIEAEQKGENQQIPVYITPSPTQVLPQR